MLIRRGRCRELRTRTSSRKLEIVMISFEKALCALILTSHTAGRLAVRVDSSGITNLHGALLWLKPRSLVMLMLFDFPWMLPSQTRSSWSDSFWLCVISARRSRESLLAFFEYSINLLMHVWPLCARSVEEDFTTASKVHNACWGCWPTTLTTMSTRWEKTVWFVWHMRATIWDRAV